MTMTELIDIAEYGAEKIGPAAQSKSEKIPGLFEFNKPSLTNHSIH